MTVITFKDGYRDLPPRNNPRALLEHELRRLKTQLWADPSDTDLLERIARVKDELAALDQGSAA